MIITIRQATEDDYKGVMSLYTKFIDKQVFHTPDDDAFHAVLKNPTSYLYVAEDEGKLVGVMMFTTRFIVRRPKQIMQLDELFVEEEYRRHGIGRRFMELLEERAHDLDCCRIYIESSLERKVAHTFYESLGYEKGGFYFKKEV